MASQILDASAKPALYKVIEYKDTTKYLVAYRAITLVPFAQQNQAGFDPVPGTVRVSTAEGQNATDNIIIIAEDIHIYAGSVFSYPGKSVTIIANRIHAVNMKGSEAAGILFDCRGFSAPDLTGQPQQPKEASQNTWDNDTGIASIHPGSQGVDGTHNQTPGQNGGKLLITGLLVCDATVDIQLNVNCCGGNGGRGQLGGTGGTGGAGADISTLERAPHYPNPGDYDGANGGVGGNGGNGSAGGDGGLIFDFTTPLNKSETGRSLKFGPTTADVKDGQRGAGADPGSGSAGGKAGLWTHITITIPRTGPPRSHEEKKEGRAGSSGDKGKYGVSGPDTARPGCVFRSSPANPITAMSLETLQLSMTMQRLLFEFQLIFCSQVPSISQPKSDYFQGSFAWLCSQMALLKQEPVVSLDSLRTMAKDAGSDAEHLDDVVQKAFEWVKIKLIASWAGRQNARAQLLESFKIFLISTCPGRNLDLYGQKLNFIKRPNLALSDLVRGIESLDRLEIQRDKVMKKIEEDAKSRSKSFATAEALSELIEGYKTDRKTLHGVFSDQADTVLKAKVIVRDRRGVVSHALDRFWASVQGRYQCKELFELLKIATVVFALAQPEFGPIVNMADQMLKYGKPFGLENPLDPYADMVDKNVLQARVEVIKGGLNPKELQAEIGKLGNKVNDPSGTNPVDSILAERNAFEALVKDCFSDLKQKAGKGDDLVKAIAAAENAFNDLMTEAQQLQKAVTSCSDTLLRLAKIEVDIKNAEANKAQLQSQNLDPTLPLLDTVMAFYSSLYTFQKAGVLRFFFEVIRACNGLFLQRSTIADDFLRFGTFDDITAAEMRAGCTTRLASDVADFLGLFNTNPAINIEDRTINISPIDQPGLFNSLLKQRRITLDITTRNYAEYFDLKENWFDIRLLDLQVFFPGATNKRARDSEPASQFIDVDVAIGDRFAVIDKSGKEHVFQVPALLTSFSYSYDGGQLKPKSSTSLPADSNFSINPNLVPNEKLDKSYPMRTPFMGFEFGVGENVDVSKVSEIRIVFALRVRNSRGKNAVD